MRIAYMLTSLGRGGAERQVIALAERMAARGHQVVLIVLKPFEAHEWPTTLEVTRLDVRKSLAGFCSGLAIARRSLRDFHPDLVHSHTFPANMLARILHLPGSAPTVLSTIHNICEGGWQRTLAYRITDRLSIHTTAVSEAVASHSVQIRAVPPGKCSVITNGIDLAEFNPVLDLRKELRNGLNAGDNFIWLAAGRVVAAKDYPNLLSAFAQVHSAKPHSQLWIAGGTQAREAKLMRGLGDQLGVSDSVHWLGLRDDMPALLDAADAFVLSSAWEGMPLVIGEAMAMQRPVVATDIGGVRELVGNTGNLVPSGNSAALADAMLGVMRMSEGDRQARGHAARERIRERFDINAKADEWEALYACLLA